MGTKEVHIPGGYASVEEVKHLSHELSKQLRDLSTLLEEENVWTMSLIPAIMTCDLIRGCKELN